MGKQWKECQTLFFGGSKITAVGDCSHEIKRRLLLGRKVMTNLNSILKSRDITLPTKVHLVKAMVFSVVMYGRESWTIKKAECWRINAFDLWCWRRLLRVPWTARRSNQSILKKISLECSLERLMLNLKLEYLGHLMWRTDSLEKTLVLGKVEGRRRREWQRIKWSDGHEFEQALGVGDAIQPSHPVFPFSSCLQSFPASGSFPMSQFLTSGRQSIGVAASASVLSVNIQDWFFFRIDWFDLLAVLGILKSLLQHHCLKASVLWGSAFFMVQFSHPYMTTGKITALTRQTFVGRVMSLVFNMLSRLVLASLVAQMVKRLPAMQETWVRSLGQEDPLEKEMATHSSILAWRIPWIVEPGRLQSMGSQRVRHDWVTSFHFTSLLGWSELFYQGASIS